MWYAYKSVLQVGQKCRLLPEYADRHAEPGWFVVFVWERKDYRMENREFYIDHDGLKLHDRPPI